MVRYGSHRLLPRGRFPQTLSDPTATRRGSNEASPVGRFDVLGCTLLDQVPTGSWRRVSMCRWSTSSMRMPRWRLAILRTIRRARRRGGSPRLRSRGVSAGWTTRALHAVGSGHRSLGVQPRICSPGSRRDVASMLWSLRLGLWSTRTYSSPDKPGGRACTPRGERRCDASLFHWSVWLRALVWASRISLKSVRVAG